MRKLFSYTINSQLNRRYEDFQCSIENPVVAQEKILLNLIEQAAYTHFGKEHRFSAISKPEQFFQQVPISTYEQLKPYIERSLHGEVNCLWPGETRWFAKSSGTTESRSKFIPVTEKSLNDNHYKAGRDLIALILKNKPYTEFYFGNGLVLGGSHQINKSNKRVNTGDLSAILTQNLPFWAKLWQQPSLKTAQIGDWESKIRQMIKEVMAKNITHITGVPTWTMVLIKKMLELNGTANLLDIWPNLELYIHGGVNFTPYRQSFEKLIPRQDMYYLETYNASEGFFGVQDLMGSDELLLLVDHGIYYEFLPMDQISAEHPRTVSLEEVELNKNYALVISTNAGLWRYLIGDTIRFSSVAPFRFKLTGRTKNFINAFGEEVIIENAEQAITAACQQTSAQLSDFTAGPVFLTDNSKGGHEWLIEFAQEPDNMEHFANILDSRLMDLNSDYEAKRANDMALVKPRLHVLPVGTFYQWMKKRGKLGGQNKVPRLFNDRTYLDDIKLFSGIRD